MREFINIIEDVWHGSPHQFDQFSTEFLGSGEGFNSFGWGLYFTSKEEIADFYRKKLSKNGTGHLYRVSLPDEDSRYLFWDKRLSEQPDPIKRAALSFLQIDVKPPEEYAWGTHCLVKSNLRLSSATIEGRGQFDLYAEDGDWTVRRKFTSLPDALKVAKGKIKEQLLRQTGEKFYESLKWELGQGAKGASLALLDKGIYGIKYLDGGSRKAKEGSYNYVIFDSSHISIVR